VRISRVAGAAYEKIRNRASRYALAGVFVARHADAVHVAVTGSGADGVFRARDFEETLSREFSAAAIAGLSIDPASLMDDWHASAEFRSHLIGVATARAVAKCEAVALNPRP
jgi:carbon-monoxide dehydrogenase medium subunit